MQTKMTADEIHVMLTTNMQDWKRNADINDVCELNSELDSDDLSTIVSSDFYDSINDWNIDLEDVLDMHYLSHLFHYGSRESFITIHNLYNM